jgi:hypothetical protein
MKIIRQDDGTFCAEYEPGETIERVEELSPEEIGRRLAPVYRLLREIAERVAREEAAKESADATTDVP